MSAHRFFLQSPLPKTSGDPVWLPLASEDVHHAVTVLRVRPGEVVEVVEPGALRAWSIRVTQASPKGLAGEPLEELARLYHPQVTLVQGVAKGDKMDAIVRQAIEVGASEVLPVLSARSVVKLDARKRAERGERWRRIAKAAAEQSHRDQVPQVHDPVSLREALGSLASYDEVVVLWEDATGSGLHAALSAWVAQPHARIALVIGPEGGLTAEEVEQLSAIGAQVVTLGPHILRTETAAIVAVALAVHHLGGLGALDAGTQ